MKLLLAIPLCVMFGIISAGAASNDYMVVAARQTANDPGWHRVIEALRQKHAGQVLLYDATPAETLPRLKAVFPRWVCFVMTRDEATEGAIRRIHQLTRELDDDPYTDLLWGILTGFNAENALAVAETRAPLTINKVAGGTEIALRQCREGVWYSEVRQGHMMRQRSGGKAVEEEAPRDTTEVLVGTLNEYQPDLFVTSGHATERDWQIGFSYRNGSFRSAEGKLFGVDTRGHRFEINSPNPKVYMPVGNCLMGHIDGADAMALAFMQSAGVRQMIGYVVPTWYGYAGWGNLDYFVEQPGRFTFAEAFFANEQALLHRLETFFPGATTNGPGRLGLTLAAREQGLTVNDARGLLFDRDVLAFYGDPAWEARMAPGPLAWKQELTETSGVFTFRIIPLAGEESFEPINTNGSQRGYRPMVELFSRRMAQIEIVSGAEFKPVITDNFVLIPNPGKCEPARDYRIVFKASPIEATKDSQANRDRPDKKP